MNKILYCPISPVLRQFGAYVTGAGKELTKPKEPYPHHYHSSDCYFTWQEGRILADCQLLYIREGRGVIEFVRDESIAVHSGTLILLRPGEWHRYRPDTETGWYEAYIALSGKYVAQVISEPFFGKSPTMIRVDPDSRFDINMLSLVDDILACNEERPYSLALRTLVLLFELVEQRAQKTNAPASDATIRRANRHIARHLGEVVDFRGLASRLGLGYTLFRTRFREYNGMAPLEYQIALRMRRAAYLLTNTSLPVARIAKETGFRTSAYFSRFFHARIGVSPIRFRQRGILAQNGRGGGI